MRRHGEPWTVRGICPSCERETGLIFVEGREDIEVRGEAILVNVYYYKCGECGVEFDDPQSPHDPLDEA